MFRSCLCCHLRSPSLRYVSTPPPPLRTTYTKFRAAYGLMLQSPSVCIDVSGIALLSSPRHAHERQKPSVLRRSRAHPCKAFNICPKLSNDAPIHGSMSNILYSKHCFHSIGTPCAPLRYTHPVLCFSSLSSLSL